MPHLNMLHGMDSLPPTWYNRLKELALGSGLYAQATLHVMQDGILETPMNNYMQPMMNAWTYAADFTSNAITE